MPYHVKKCTSQSNLLVFGEIYTSEEIPDYEAFIRNFEDNFEAREQDSWFAFWRAQGEDIVLEQWKRKYHSYLGETHGTTEKSQEVNDIAKEGSEEEDNFQIKDIQVIEDNIESKNLKSIELDRALDDIEVADQKQDFSYKETSYRNDLPVAVEQAKHISEKVAVVDNYNKDFGWQELWDQHFQEVYAEQYILYTNTYYDYYLSVKESLETTEFDELEEKNLLETQINLSAEIEQLQLLDLPTAFGNRSQQTRRKNRSKAETTETEGIYLGKLGSHYCEDEDDCSCNVSISSDMEDSTLSDMEAFNNLGTTISTLLTTENESRSKKKRRNRKLRKVPVSLLKEKNMLKYWRKRYSLFSRFDDGIRLDHESWYSVTPEQVALNLAKTLRCDVLVDGFCGCGGNAIQFARTCSRVIAIDIDPIKIEMAKHNAIIYGVAEKIDFIVGDFLQLSSSGKIQADLVFLSPPWGGPNYKRSKNYDIQKYLVPVGATELMKCARHICDKVALYLPKNSKIQQMIALAGVGKRCKVEHHYLNTRLLAITAVYGIDELTKSTEEEEQSKPEGFD